jgi:uncharacterized membrane protein YecN with MAPEG domain
MAQFDQRRFSSSSQKSADEDDRAMTRSQPIERQVIQTFTIKTTIGTTLAFIVLYWLIPLPIPALLTVTDRLVYTLRLQSFSCLTLIGGILKVSLTRFHTTAIDPINGRGEHHVAVSIRYLTNTVEQFIVSFVGQMILATYLNEDQMKAIPILVLFFVAGRVLFYFGYNQSYLRRAIGFVLTFGVSLMLWLAVMLCVISDLLSPSVTQL